MICGNIVGGSSGLNQTYMIEDAYGNSCVGVVVDNEVIFTATDADVREGKIYASDKGVSIGTLRLGD